MFRSYHRLIRLLLALAFALAVGFGLRRLGLVLERRSGRAGFVQGVFQGATMPMAMPTLVLGYDVAIYATENNGPPYKLGYTLGVTGCGAFFFGTVYSKFARRKPTE